MGSSPHSLKPHASSFFQVKHSHFERRQLGVEEDEVESPHVRRKLFSLQAAAEADEEAEVAIQMLEWVGEADPRETPMMTPVGRLWAQRRPLMPPAKKVERVASTSGKKTERLSTEDSKEVEEKPVVFSDYRTSRQTGSEDSDSDGGDGGQATDATSSRATPAAGSSAYKRSLSRALSSDAFVARERKPSVTNCPPCKASKNVAAEETPVTSKATEETPAKIQPTKSFDGLEETPTTSQPSQRLLMKTRSSTRINGGKSLLSSFQNPPDEKPKPMLTPKSLKSSRSMSRAFTTTNLKVQSNDKVSETPSEPLPKPSRKLVSSITTSCLKSFQEFHISPESKIVTEVNEENDLPVPRPKFARSNSKKFQKPAEVNCRIKSLCYNFSYV